MIMRVNADFLRPAVVLPEQYVWVPSPQPGIERLMLDRIGAETARATSIVRYAADSVFPEHSHPGGEEILVLSGTFSEDGRHFPQGWYLRNPPGSAHTPSSASGATIFVKLMQMPATQHACVRVDTNDVANWESFPGLDVCPLFSDESECVELLRLAAFEPVAAAMPDQPARLTEFLVLSGILELTGAAHPAGSWVRLPAGDAATLAEMTAGPEGVTLYVKTYVPPVPFSSEA